MKKFILFVCLAAAAAPAAAGLAGCVYDMDGQVSVRAAGAQDWAPARRGRQISEGDAVRTGDRAWCGLLFRDGTYVKLDPGSEMTADELRSSAGSRQFSFSFLKGKALWMAARLKAAAAATFSVRTPSAVCAVRGTDFSVAVSSSGTSVGLFEGKVALSADGAEKELLPGGQGDVSAGQIAVQARLSRLMQAEQRRYERVKGRIEALRKRMAARDGYIDDYVSRQQKALQDLEKRRKEKLDRR